MVTQIMHVKTPEAETLEIAEQLAQIQRMRGRGGSVAAATPASRRERIIASIPSAADLDLIVIEPPVEWLADEGWK